MQRWLKMAVPVDDDAAMIAWYAGLSIEGQRKQSATFKARIQELIGAKGDAATKDELAEFERAYRPGIAGEKDDLAGLKRERAFYLFRMQKARAKNNHAQEAEAAKQFRAFSESVRNAELLALRLGRDLGESFSASDVDRLGRAVAYWLMNSADVLSGQIAAGVSAVVPIERSAVRRIVEPLVTAERMLSPLVRATRVNAGVALPKRFVEAVKVGVAACVEDGAEEFEKLYTEPIPPQIQAAMNWIKTAGRLPPIDHWVLTWDGDSVERLKRIDWYEPPYCWGDDETPPRRWDEITHWMELPAPPEPQTQAA